jgi:hypothetical protein
VKSAVASEKIILQAYGLRIRRTRQIPGKWLEGLFWRPVMAIVRTRGLYHFDRGLTAEIPTKTDG